MFQVTDNEDGTRNLILNSGDLGALKGLAELVPYVEKVLTVVDTPDVRALVDFVKSLGAEPAAKAGADE
jgi:hypothetical protein